MAEATPGRVMVFERAENIPRAWDRVARTAGLSMKRPFVQAMHKSLTAAKNRRYLVYEHSSGAAAIGVAELLVKPSERNPVAGVLLGRLNRYIPGALDWMLPMLLLRADSTNDVSLVADAPTESGRAFVLDEMLTALARLAGHEGWSLGVASVPADDTALLSTLRQRGYLHTVGRPCASLQLGFDSWDAFLESAARGNKNAARNIRHEISRARRDGVTIRDWDPARIPESELYGLMVEHERRVNRRSFGYRPGFLSSLAESLGNNVRFLVAQREQQVLGVVVFAWTGSQGYVFFPGLIARADRVGLAYFNLAFYEPIKLAINLGLDSLACGNAALEAKLRRGCIVRENRLFFRPRGGVARATLKVPVAVHRRLLQRKYAAILQAPAFSSQF